MRGRSFTLFLSRLLRDLLLWPFSRSTPRSFLTSGLSFLLSCFRGTLVFASFWSSPRSFRRRWSSGFLLLFLGSSPTSLLRWLCRLFRGRRGLAGSFTSCAHCGLWLFPNRLPQEGTVNTGRPGVECNEEAKKKRAKERREADGRRERKLERLIAGC